MINGDILVTEKKCVKDRYPAFDSENSICARLCSHVSNRVRVRVICIAPYYGKHNC